MPPVPTTPRMGTLLEKEALERRRQEAKVRRLRGALRHLLADGENLDCGDPNHPTSVGTGPRERLLGHGTTLESTDCRGGVGNPAERHWPDGVAVARDCAVSVARPRHDASGTVGDSQGGLELADLG